MSASASVQQVYTPCERRDTVSTEFGPLTTHATRSRTNKSDSTVHPRTSKPTRRLSTVYSIARASRCGRSNECTRPKSARKPSVRDRTTVQTSVQMASTVLTTVPQPVSDSARVHYQQFQQQAGRRRFCVRFDDCSSNVDSVAHAARRSPSRTSSRTVSLMWRRSPRSPNHLPARIAVRFDVSDTFTSVTHD